MADPAAGTSTLSANHRTQGEESATTLPFDGGPLERVIRSQRLEVVPSASGAGQDTWTVLAPVTERGEVIGVLELELPGRAARRRREEERWSVWRR